MPGRGIRNTGANGYKRLQFLNLICKSNKEYGIVLLTTEESLLFLSNSHRMLGDGTFKSCPKFFFQLYTLHAFQNGRYTPCMFCLLPDKKKTTYEKMLEMLLETTRELQIELCPEEMFVDLEVSVHAALSSTWPSCKIRLCHFHLSQAWFRKIQELGLTAEYKNNDSEIGQWLKLFFAIPLLPTEDIEECFAFPLMPIQPPSDKAEKFADYIFQQYICQTARFLPAMWAGIDKEDVTTTNSCEAFHIHFSKRICPHPNIFRFLDTLKQEQEKVNLKICCAGQPSPKKRKEYRDKKQKKEQ